MLIRKFIILGREKPFDIFEEIDCIPIDNCDSIKNQMPNLEIYIGTKLDKKTAVNDVRCYLRTITRSTSLDTFVKEILSQPIERYIPECSNLI